MRGDGGDPPFGTVRILPFLSLSLSFIEQKGEMQRSLTWIFLVFVVDDPRRGTPRRPAGGRLLLLQPAVAHPILTLIGQVELQDQNEIEIQVVLYRTPLLPSFITPAQIAPFLSPLAPTLPLPFAPLLLVFGGLVPLPTPGVYSRSPARGSGSAAGGREPILSCFLCRGEEWVQVLEGRPFSARRTVGWSIGRKGG